jgi:hypothetical protein
MIMKSQPFVRNATLAALCTLVLSPAALFAANAHKTAEERGVIKSVDVTSHQLIVTDQKTKADGTFQWNDHTKFSEQRKNVNSSALKAGMAVHINYTPSSGTPVLQHVMVSPGKKQKHTSASTSVH